MTAGFFAPLPPARTGVADYAAALLGEMRKLGRVEIGAAEADTRLYHLGNNQLHRATYEQALERPGVVVLHDAVLHHFLLGGLTERAYIDEFVYNYGEWNRGLGQTLWRDRARSAADPRYFEYPMLRRAVESARVVVVHNPAAARIVRAHAEAARVVEIPHLFVQPEAVDRADVEKLRRGMGMDAGDFLFGVFGHLRESKRLASVVAAFERVRREMPRAGLLIAGDFVSTDLARSLEPSVKAAGVRRIGFLKEPDFWRYAAAVDACVNLRYPAAGESSGIAIRLMGIGKPVMVTEGEETSRIPEGACVRVDTGDAEIDMLTEYMRWMAISPGAAREIGARAAAHIAEHHAIDRVAAQFWRVLEESR
ncbi:MAG: glycosyltransferase [Bryobacteraceae bacterium]